MLGYGGGPSSIPLIHREVVERYRWITDEEFSDILALGNTLPGPIATKMAGYIGNRVGGLTGSINAVIATIIPTVVLMICLIGFLATYSNSPVVQGITSAIIPVVGVMLGSLAYKFFKQSKEKMGWMQMLLLSCISLIAIQLVNLHPAIIIGGLLIYSVTKKDKVKNDTNVKKETLTG